MSTIAMKPSQLADFLKEAIRAHIPVLVKGAPGIGKTQITHQVTSALDADLIISYPAVEDPTDPKGLPWPGADGEEAHFLPFGNLRRAGTAGRLTVWDIEDLGQATPAVQASYMQLIRGTGPHPISEHVTFVATTNRRTDRAGVNGLLEPVKSSFGSIVELEPDLQDWCLWALDSDVVPDEMVAFMRFRGEDLLCDFNPSMDLDNSPLPRTWEHAARIQALSLGSGTMASALAGAVGEAAANEYLTFLSLYKSLPNIDAILQDPSTGQVPDRPNALYALVTALGARADAGNFGNVAQYATRLMDEGRGEFAALLVRDATHRHPELTETDSFGRLITGDLGDLIGGGVA